MALKQKIEEILFKENYTFSQLADYLGLTEADLAAALDNRTLELRYLEEMSKVLKVPLYSFFRTEGYSSIISSEKPYYINKLWESEEDRSPQKLMEDIQLLKEALAHREAELKNWQNKKADK